METLRGLPRLVDPRMQDFIGQVEGNLPATGNPVAGSSSGPGTIQASEKSAKAKGKERARDVSQTVAPGVEVITTASPNEAYYTAIGAGGERIRTVKSMMKKALQGIGGRDTSAQLFVSLCRSMGLGARLIVSLQPLNWKADKPSAAKKSNGKSSGGSTKNARAQAASQKRQKAAEVAKAKGLKEQDMMDQAKAFLDKTNAKAVKAPARRKGKVPEKTHSEEEEEDDMEEVQIPDKGEDIEASPVAPVDKRTPSKGRAIQREVISVPGSEAEGDSDTGGHANAAVDDLTIPHVNPRLQNLEHRFAMRKPKPQKEDTIEVIKTKKQKRKEEGKLLLVCEAHGQKS